MNINSQDDKTRYPSLPQQAYQPQQQDHEQDHVVGQPVRSVQLQLSPDQTVKVNKSKKTIRDCSSCIQIWAYFIFISCVLSLSSDIKTLMFINQINGEPYEWVEEDGTTDSITLNLTFVMWLLALSMVISCLYIYQVKSTIELVKPILFEVKQEKNGNHVQMSRRSKQTDALLTLIKKIVVATLITKCFVYYILATQLPKSFDSAFDLLIEEQIEDGNIVVYVRTRNTEVTAGMNLMSLARLYVDPSNTQKQSHLVQQLTQQQTIRYTTQANLDQRVIEAKEEMHQYIQAFVYTLAFITILLYSITQCIYYSIVKNIKQAQEFLEVTYLGPETSANQGTSARGHARGDVYTTIQ